MARGGDDRDAPARRRGGLLAGGGTSRHAGAARTGRGRMRARAAAALDAGLVAGLDQRYGGRLMTVVEASTVVDAPPAAVWKVVSDPRNLPRWDRWIGQVRGADPGPFHTGSEYETEVRF